MPFSKYSVISHLSLSKISKLVTPYTTEFELNDFLRNYITILDVKSVVKVQNE